MSHSLSLNLDFELPDTCTFFKNLIIEDPKNDTKKLESAAMTFEDDWPKANPWADAMPNNSNVTEITNLSNVNPQMVRSTNIPTAFSVTGYEHFQSALAANTSISSSYQTSTALPPKRRKMNKFMQKDEPDTSDIDINATLHDLGLSQEMFGASEVYKLFSLFKKLSFFIYSNYIFENISDERQFPRTLSVSVQIKHAIWSCRNLFYKLRIELESCSHAWLDYLQPLTDCRLALENLNTSIMHLDQFNSCNLEHQGGVFVTPGAHGYASQLTRTLEEVIERVGKCRLYLQVIAWASNKFKREGVNCEHFPVNEYKDTAKPMSIGRPVQSESTEVNRTVRRYIGSE